MLKRVVAGMGACGLAVGVLGLAACSADEAPGLPQAANPNGAAAGNAGEPLPRVVLVLSLDTLRADRLGLYGYEKFTSPVLDMIAAEGVVFEDASAPSPWTLPSHASMLTGLYPKRHGVQTMSTGLPDDVATLAAMLSGSGFETAAVVNSTWLRKENYRVTRDFDKYLFIEDVAHRRAPNTWVTDQAIEWLDEMREQKLFVFVHYYDVHSDYVSEPAYENLFTTPYDGIVDGTGWQLTRANLEQEHIELCHERFDPEMCTFGNPGGSLVVDSSVEKLELDRDDVRRLNELYDAGIRQLDAELSRLFAWMRREGILDETLLVVTSDHGEEFMEHGRVDHFVPMWQELLRVPLLFRGPGLRVGARIEAPVSLVDLVPTIVSLAGAELAEPTDGVDLSALMRPTRKPAGDAVAVERILADRYLYGEAAGGLTYVEWMEDVFPVHRSVRRGRHKLIWESKGETYALYDLAVDPGESTDVRAEHPEVSNELIAEMERRFRDEGLEPALENRVELSEEESERLRSLGYLK